MTRICGLCLAVLLSLSLCVPAPSYAAAPSDEGVEEFLGVLEDAPLLYLGDRCRQVTPPGLYEDTGYRLFKFEQSCASYLYYEGAAYPLGQWFGGTGLDTAAAADLDGDGVKELYFTYSWGSGMYHGQIGWFDPASRTVALLDYVAGLPLLVTEAGTVWFAGASDGVLRGVKPAGALRRDGETVVFEEFV